MGLALVSSKKSTNDRIILFMNAVNRLSRWSPGIAARVAEQLFITPTRHRRPRRESAWERTATPISIETPDRPLAAWAWGDGPRTILLVHGWAGRGLQLGAFAAPLVEAGFRVVAFDGPAHGSSPGRQSNLFRHTAGLVAVARAAGPVHGVIAHSLGTTAVLLAISRGELSPGRFVAISPMGDTRSMAAQFGSITGFSPDVVAAMRTRLENRFDFRWDDIEPRRLALGVGADTLIIHDRDDRELPVADVNGLAKSLPRAEIVLTNGLGHHRILRDVGVVDRATRFVARDVTASLPAAVVPEAHAAPAA